MGFWVLVSIVVLGAAALAATGRVELRRRGFVLVGIALLLTVGIEALIQSEVVAVARGTELLGIALILLAAWAIWRLPRAGRDDHGN